GPSRRHGPVDRRVRTRVTLSGSQPQPGRAPPDDALQRCGGRRVRSGYRRPGWEAGGPVPVTSRASLGVAAAGVRRSGSGWSALEGFLALLAGLLDVALGLVGSAFGLQFLVVGGPAKPLLGLPLELLGLVSRLVVGSHAGAVLS